MGLELLGPGEGLGRGQDASQRGVTCLGCRQLGGAESSPGVAVCGITLLQDGCLPLCNVFLLDPGGKGLPGFHLAQPARKVALACWCGSKA